MSGSAEEFSVLVNPLTKRQFLETFDAPMRFVEADDEQYQPVQIGDYVADCIEELDLPTSRRDIEIHYVYTNDKRPFDHVLLNWGERNVYLVVVTERREQRAFGHFLLDLNEEYGLYEPT